MYGSRKTLPPPFRDVLPGQNSFYKSADVRIAPFFPDNAPRLCCFPNSQYSAKTTGEIIE